MEDIDFGAENLEDGELWLPPDFFSVDEVKVSTKFATQLNHCSSPKPYCMDDLMLRFSVLNVMEAGFHYNRSLSKHTPSLPLQLFKPAVCCGFTGGVCCNVCNFSDCGSGGSWSGNSTVHQYLRRLNPSALFREANLVKYLMGSLHFLQAEAFMTGKSRAPQMEQRARFNADRVLHGVRMGGGHAGTGVFLPRISSNDMASANFTRNQNPPCVRNGQGTTRKHEIQLPRKILLNQMQEECRGYLTPGAQLPNDWRY